MSQTEVQLIKNGAVVDADINGMSSSKLSGALPAISGAALTNLPAGAGKAKNLIINGAMQVAQRGTSSTSQGYQTVDRVNMGYANVDEAPTQAQVDVASGTTPYTLGFRKAFKITNGNQTSGAGADDYIYFNAQAIEAQNLANSGWNFKSSSSNITLSFYVKSSVAQNFYFQFDVRDGTRYAYAMETGTLTADTWTKVTKVIPGNSNLTIDNDNGVGAYITFGLFWGTNLTGSVSLNTWGVASDSAKTPNYTSTWYTTNDATFEITGVQLEVGDSATDFEHRSFAQELALCQRYYYRPIDENNKYLCLGFSDTSTMVSGFLQFPVTMRANPSIDASYGVSGSIGYWRIANGNFGGDKYIDNAWSIIGQTPNATRVYATPRASLTVGEVGFIESKNSSSYMAFTAEL